MKKYIFLLALLFTGVLTGYSRQSAYLFVYFTGNRMSEEAIRMAVSPDGYNYYALNRNHIGNDHIECFSIFTTKDMRVAYSSRRTDLAGVDDRLVSVERICQQRLH